MKIEVGMYIRTKYRTEVVIRQVKNIFETSEHDHQLVFDKPTRHQYYVEDNNFIAREKLIELIEAGDYVNGQKVDYILDGKLIYYVKTYYGKDQFYIELPIKDIVTKEQFEREKYTIGDD